jgi:hypothetical protein
MSRPFDAGDVIIVGDQIIIESFTGKQLNIRNLVKSFDVFESLNNSTLTADFYIADGIELLNYFPVAGEETITVTFQTPNRKALTYKFFVESIVGQKSNDTSVSKTYILRCVTKDFLKNSYTVYTKRYKDLDYSAAVKKVITEDLKSEIGSLYIENTQGKFDYVVNGVRPFQTIALLCERAVSAKYKSSFFYFYQDNEGYHFRTIEDLIEERRGLAEMFTYKFPTNSGSNPYEKNINFRNILSYETMSQGSTTDKVKSGAFYTQVREFDMMNGDYYNKWEYINPSDHKSFSSTDNTEDFNSASFNGEVIQLPAVTRMVVKDGLRPDMKHNEAIVNKRAFQNRINQYGLRLRIYGDTTMRVGDVIKAELPDISGVTVSPNQQKIYSENYIILEMKHRLDQKEGGLFEHFIILDLRKTNMYTSIG